MDSVPSPHEPASATLQEVLAVHQQLAKVAALQLATARACAKAPNKLPPGVSLDPIPSVENGLLPYEAFAAYLAAARARVSEVFRRNRLDIRDNGAWWRLPRLLITVASVRRSLLVVALLVPFAHNRWIARRQKSRLGSVLHFLGS